jgi:hemerythrin superfamily protein
MAITEPRRKSPRNKPRGLRQIRRAAGITNAENAIRVLRADHREVEALFKQFKRADSAGRKEELARTICAALKLHSQIEEEVFYPAFIAATGEKDLHEEALVEHDAAKKLIAEIDGSGPGDALFDARVTVLSEMIRHHVKEEERLGGIFFKARVARMDLRAVGALLQARKQELESAPAKDARPSRSPRRPARSATGRATKRSAL